MEVHWARAKWARGFLLLHAYFSDVGKIFLAIFALFYYRHLSMLLR